MSGFSLAIAGISDVTEDGILATIPKGSDPETAFVCDNINAGRKNKDGSIHWNNYGTHAPVVSNAINEYLKKGGKADAWVAKELVADDARLKKLIADDPDFRGAIVWVVGHPETMGDRIPRSMSGEWYSANMYVSYLPNFPRTASFAFTIPRTENGPNRRHRDRAGIFSHTGSSAFSHNMRTGTTKRFATTE